MLSFKFQSHSLNIEDFTRVCLCVSEPDLNPLELPSLQGHLKKIMLVMCGPQKNYQWPHLVIFETDIWVFYGFLKYDINFVVNLKM